jgi:hypothetical protein
MGMYSFNDLALTYPILFPCAQLFGLLLPRGVTTSVQYMQRLRFRQNFVSFLAAPYSYITVILSNLGVLTPYRATSP